MNWMLWAFGGYLAIGLVVGIASLLIGGGIKQTISNIVAWPLALVFIAGLLKR